MTIETTTAKQFFTADGTTGTFYFTYRLLRAADLQVYVTETLIDPGEYSVTINANGVGGNVQFTIPPGTLLDPVRGLVYRYVNYTQETHLPTESDFDQKSVENALDKLTMEVQQLQEQINRAATLSLFDESGATVVLPPPNSRRALLWHPDEDGRLINSTYDPDTLFDSTSALLVLMQGYLVDALAAQAAALAAQAAAEVAQAAAEAAAGTATTASGNYGTYFPSLVGPSTQSPGDMLVWQEVAPSVFGYGDLSIGAEDDILQVVSGVPTWAVMSPPPLPPTDTEMFLFVANFLQEGANVTLFKDYDAKTITINATGPSPVPPPPPPSVVTGSTTITFTKRVGTGWDSSTTVPTPPGSGFSTNTNTQLSFSGGGVYSRAYLVTSTIDSLTPGVTADEFKNGVDYVIYNIAGAITGDTITATLDYQYTP